MADYNVIDYSFKVVSPDEFTLSLIFDVPNKFFEKIYEGARDKLKGKGVDAPAYRQGAVSRFEIPESYFGVIKTATRKNALEVFKMVKSDGIVVIRYRVLSAVFERFDFWRCYVVLGGYYANKRSS